MDKIIQDYSNGLLVLQRIQSKIDKELSHGVISERSWLSMNNKIKKAKQAIDNRFYKRAKLIKP